MAMAAALSLALPCYAVPPPDRAAASHALQEGRLGEAITALRTIVAANPKDAAAQLLLCRAYYAEEDIDAAVNACTAAINNGSAQDSATQDWAGRAFGLKAEHAGMFGGFSLAKKTRAAFEAAVAANPKSEAAVDDLAEFYVGAPGVVGGGTDKATALAKRVEADLPQSAHRTRALVADKAGDTAAAEREYRAAIAVANSPAAWVDLGHFFAKHKQHDQAVIALKKALMLDTAKDAAIVDAASILNEMHREPALAEKALRDYLASSNKSDAAPAPKVHVELGRLLGRTDSKAAKTAARAEFDAALALAPGYAAARKAMEAL
jgi:tetratricopeptide (TPR) repeat protein